MIPLGVLGASRVQAAGGTLSVEFADVATDIANASVYTFPAVDIGAPSSDRVVVVGFGLRTGGSSVVNAITIGGTSATIDIQSFNSGSRAAFARAAIPSGTTADVVVTLAAGAVRAGIGVWRVTGGPVALSDSDSYGVVGPTGSLNVDVASGGIALACLANSSSGTTWTGLTEDYDVQTGAEAGGISGGRSDTGVITFNTGSGTPQAIAVSYAPA